MRSSACGRVAGPAVALAVLATQSRTAMVDAKLRMRIRSLVGSVARNTGFQPVRATSVVRRTPDCAYSPPGGPVLYSEPCLRRGECADTVLSTVPCHPKGADSWRPT